LRVDDPPESLIPDDNFPKFLSSLQYFDFESIIDYDEAHGQSAELRSYLMAMKDGAARTNWFVNEAELQLAIKKRTIGTKDGSPPFRFFDAGKCRNFRQKRANGLLVTGCALLSLSARFAFSATLIRSSFSSRLFLKSSSYHDAIPVSVPPRGDCPVP